MNKRGLARGCFEFVFPHIRTYNSIGTIPLPTGWRDVAKLHCLQVWQLGLDQPHWSSSRRAPGARHHMEGSSQKDLPQQGEHGGPEGPQAGMGLSACRMAPVVKPVPGLAGQGECRWYTPKWQEDRTEVDKDAWKP